MTKADIANKITEKVGLPQKESQEIVEILLDTIKDALVEGESVKIPEFGTFNVSQKSARKGRNPQTGEDLTISPRRVISFMASNRLKTKLEQTKKR